MSEGVDYVLNKIRADIMGEDNVSGQNVYGKINEGIIRNMSNNIVPNNMNNATSMQKQAFQNGRQISKQPYIFSDEMRERLAFLESGGNYKAHNLENGGIGALGRYQIRRGGLIDAGYINQNNQWLGKNGVYSQDDFFNNPDKQEQVLDDFMKSIYGQLKHKGALNYSGSRIHGIVKDFDITDTGLLAASHREGAGAVNRYLNKLEKNQNNIYYMDYDKITDPDIVNMFKRIETRLRKFEK